MYAIRMGPPDTTPPNIAVEDIYVEATSADGAYVTFWPKAYDEVDGFVPVYCEPYIGSLFPIGETTVTVTATDKSGNTATATFKVIVQDTTPPVISGPSEILVPVDESGTEGTVYFEGFSAYDAVDGPAQEDGPVKLLITFESGSKLPLGTTNVTCVAEDSRDNIAIKTVKVIVTNRVGVASSNPAKYRNDVDPESPITLAFNRSVELTEAASGISIKENGYVIESTYSLSADGMTLTVIPEGGLRHGMVYTITLPEGAAVDAADPEMLSLPYTLTFRTIEAPPVSAETDTSGRTIILTFDKPLADVAGKHSQFKAIVNGIERTLRAALQGTNKKQVILELDGPVLASSDTVTVSYTPGDLKTMDGGIFNAFNDFPVENKTLFDGGTGTEEDPYLISSAAQLDAIRYDLGTHYRLKTDIDLGNYDTGYGSLGWLPIGDADNPFTGTLDGDGHSINGLHIERLTTDNVGLFGFISGGTIKDISLTNADVGGRHNVGALAGTGLGNGIRTNIHVDGHVSAAYSIGGINIGGIFGVSYSDILESSFEGSAWGNENVGGIAGTLINSLISESYTNVDIRGYKNVGGLIGLLIGIDQEVSVTNSYSAGLLIGGGSFSPDPMGCGGLVGFIDGTAELTNSFASVEMDVDNEEGSLIGGLIGNNESSGITVSNSFYNSSLYTFNNSVFYGMPLTTLEMKSADEFENAGWDFENVWAISEGTYPYLKKFGIKDFAPPVVLSTSPVDGEENVSVLRNLTVTFDEPLMYFKDDDNNIKEITDPASLVELHTSTDPVEFTALLSEDRKELTIIPVGGLNQYRAYYLSVKYVGDANKNLVPRINVSFVTGNYPVECVIVSSQKDVAVVGDLVELNAEIIPAQVSHIPVVWSLEAEEGIATLQLIDGLDKTAFLYCTGAGTVTVTATADDGSGVSGSKVITIKEKPAFESVTVNPVEIPEGKESTLKVTVVTKNVDDGSVITSVLQSTQGGVVEETRTTAVVTGNTAEINMTVPSDVPHGDYWVITSLEFMGNPNYITNNKLITIRKVEKLSTPTATVDQSNKSLSWSWVPFAGSYIITITPEDPEVCEPIVITRPAGDGTSMSIPPLPVTDARNGNAYFITVSAVPHEDDMYHIASDTSEPVSFVSRLKSLVVVEPPAKNVYYPGENIDLTGLVVKGITPDDQEILLDDITEADIRGFDPDFTIEQYVDITYGGVTLYNAFSVRVLGVAGFEVSQEPYKYFYYIGEELDLTGLVVTAIYSDASRREVPMEELEITGFDSSSEGTKTVSVWYRGRLATFEVYVMARSAELDAKVKLFDINEPSDVSVNITWNDATEITTVEVEYFDNMESEWKYYTLEQDIDYAIEDDVLIIKADFFARAMEFDCYYFWIEFNVGDWSWLDVRVIDGNKTYNAALSNLYVGYDWKTGEFTPLQGFDPDIYEYYVLVPEGTSPYDMLTWIKAEATDDYAEILYSELEEIPGSVTVTVMTWDLKPVSTYTIYFTTSHEQVPAITVQPVSQEVTEGDTVTFTVEATGTEPLSYKWMKNGIELIDDDNISGVNTNTLTINNVQLSDAGSYTVVVTNSVGSVTSEAAVLTVNPAPVAPSITTQPISQTVTEGDTVTFTVEATGTEPLSYKWLKDGIELTNNENISGVSTNTLTINNVQLSDAGSYAVVVTNAVGSVTSEAAVLTVNPAPVAPSIATQPLSHTVTEGDTVTFTVEATGTEPLSYKWMKNGIELTDSENISGANTNTLTINNVQLSDAGSYTVVVTNEVGSVTSEAAVLTVNPAPPANTAPNRKAGVPETATASVIVNSAFTLDLSTIFEDTDDDPLTYKVSVNGAEYIEASEEYSYTPTATGTVTLVFKANDGTEDSSDTYTVTLKVSNPGSGAGGGFGGGIIIIDGSDNDDTEDTQTYYANVSGIEKTDITLSVNVNTDMDNATVELENILNSDLFAGTGTTVITVPSIPDVNSYSIEIPATFLSGLQEGDALTFSTDVGSITIPSDMLSGLPEIEGKKARITIGQGDKSSLPEDVKAAIGDRPIVQLTLTLDGTQTEWNNPDAPVTVRIPYTPTAEELADPEHIVIWYIDGSGNIISVPNGRYDPETGTVTFTTTHFSYYAVAYVRKTFSDLGSVEWARRPVEVLASKGIINGTSKDTFSPDINITRADYLVLLVKTLGLTTSFDSNFDDVKPDSYYFEAVGIAKKLGITTGVGNNRFNPMEYISRQDMMVLTARALEKYKVLKTAKDMDVLNKFIDKEDIAEYAIGSTATLVKEGLIVGSGDRLNPNAFTTRAEAAVILYRIFNKYSGI